MPISPDEFVDISRLVLKPCGWDLVRVMSQSTLFSEVWVISIPTVLKIFSEENLE